MNKTSSYGNVLDISQTLRRIVNMFLWQRCSMRGTVNQNANSPPFKIQADGTIDQVIQRLGYLLTKQI